MKSIRKTSTSKYLDQLKRKSCACGDPLCNRIGEFLGHVVTMKCGYRRSSEFEDEQKKRKKVRGVQIKRKRCELIHEEIVAMRRRFLEDKHERARKYTQTQISKESPQKVLVLMKFIIQLHQKFHSNTIQNHFTYIMSRKYYPYIRTVSK